MRGSIVRIILGSFLTFCSTTSLAALEQFCSIIPGKSTADKGMVINVIPSRVQWNSTNGYCGEVSLISAGLYYGQYVSQYDARRLANLDFSKKNKQLDQILLGYKGQKSQDNNVINALQNMHLTFEQFDNTTNRKLPTSNFLLWIKKQVLAHYPVAIGVYDNNSIFDGKSEPEYDHIVPVFGIKTTHPIQPLAYYDDDVIYFHDNSLYTEVDFDCYQYLFKTFQKTRQDANAEGGDVYSLSNNVNHLGNFGIAVTGIHWTGVPLMPVRIQTKPVDEYPEIQNNSDIRPRAELLNITIEVSDLKPQTYYILYKYTDFNQLPKDDNFALSSGNPVKTCSIWLGSGVVFQTREQILSSSMAIYRVIAAPPNQAIPTPCD